MCIICSICLQNIKQYFTNTQTQLDVTFSGDELEEISCTLAGVNYYQCILTTFYKYIKPLVDSIKSYFAFSNRSIFELKEEQIDKLGSIVLDIKNNWNSFVLNCQTVKNMDFIMDMNIRNYGK